ncbi:phosphoenolpyruvate--protein phosphotransferase [[Clostridium] symbiosum]|uniref:phosphoenolpyruvate--protein phosphotransferase n=1 Tax=Clostridium symbiosum TaxID=1512 RepID=UPI001D07CC87|nr:phosphoenolpyruvate--protein phosphotransferase [[Clostridium] symbiosum]MCB6608770.1 phosphoenolpyruvate--protein phosphotransferase [[Clostridium] symbiosum]MCB6929628.1 phosphoenolpyruvate--protein phosphotransferase [[Clostridium] symbiosum]
MARGTGASAGIGIGRAVILKEEQLVIENTAVEDAEAEKLRFKKAVEQSIADVSVLAEDMASRIGEKEAEILNGHLMLLQDPMLTGEIENQIENDKVCSEFAVETVCNMYADMFASMDDELMQQRAADMRDIKTRMQKLLLGVQSVDVSLLPAGTILMAEDLTPSVTAGINPSNVTGIVTELGGRTSHSAILSRALEIPAVVAAAGILSEVKDGDELILDGETGEIFLNPDSSLRAEYEQKRSVYLQEKEELKKYIGMSSTTKDGVTVEVAANIGKPEDVDRVIAYDGEGIGLFRTEFLFMDRNEMPTEEEQFEAYQKVAVAMKGKPVIIRTLDIGGDKEIPYMGLKKDENPFLGYRAIRFCLDRKDDIYRPQLRALLRASAFGNIKIMVPMVTCIEEYREARALVTDIMKELDEKGIAYNKEIQVGIMVETAAASLMADVFAKEVDFFSIGTNDLTQYTMSVDRGNDKVSYLYSTFNPAVLRSIRHIIECGRREGIMVGMCGEAASDPLMIPLLLAFGLNEFSMSASAILKARKYITEYSVEELKAVADKAMSLVTAAEIEQLMKEFVRG